MEENYIHIFTSFLVDVMQEKKLTIQDAYKLLRGFEKVCEDMKTRQDLINFINVNLENFPELELLKTRLMDASFVFPPAPVEQE